MIVSESLESRLSRVKFSSSIPGADRVHYVNQRDVRVVLSRLPLELWHRLRAVYFNDQARGARVLGYVTAGHREIGLCALPPRMSLTRFLVKGQSPEQLVPNAGSNGRSSPSVVFSFTMFSCTNLDTCSLSTRIGVQSACSLRVKNWLKSSPCGGASASGPRRFCMRIPYTIRQGPRSTFRRQLRGELGNSTVQEKSCAAEKQCSGPDAVAALPAGLWCDLCQCD